MAAIGAKQVLAYYEEYDARAVGGAYNPEEELAMRGFYDEVDTRDYKDASTLFLRDFEEELTTRQLRVLGDLKEKKEKSKAAVPEVEGEAKAIQAELDSVPDSEVGYINVPRLKAALTIFQKSLLLLAKYTLAAEGGDPEATKKAEYWKENTKVFAASVLQFGAKDDPISLKYARKAVTARQSGIGKTDGAKKGRKNGPTPPSW